MKLGCPASPAGVPPEPKRVGLRLSFTKRCQLPPKHLAAQALGRLAYGLLAVPGRETNSTFHLKRPFG